MVVKVKSREEACDNGRSQRKVIVACVQPEETTARCSRRHERENAGVCVWIAVRNHFFNAPGNEGTFKVRSVPPAPVLGKVRVSADRGLSRFRPIRSS